ncbi:MAG: type II toxin-antitoxin system Phd/YefM family antitoxin [Candidatus Sumerlaeota bacterium]|nr:type II toxin-antitoxin system Phd/YefM family antitoxin [Candidatus Sumerlaeota bacterium]
MRTFTYSEARKHLSNVLDAACEEEVVIKRREGETFCLIRQTLPKSSFDVPGIRTKATTRDILAAIKETRERSRS